MCEYCYGFSTGDDAAARLRRALIHNHSTTNLSVVGYRKPGECGACDHERQRAERQNRSE